MTTTNRHYIEIFDINLLTDSLMAYHNNREVDVEYILRFEYGYVYTTGETLDGVRHPNRFNGGSPTTARIHDIVNSLTNIADHELRNSITACALTNLV